LWHGGGSRRRHLRPAMGYEQRPLKGDFHPDLPGAALGPALIPRAKVAGERIVLTHGEAHEFAEIPEAANTLSLDDQAELIEMLRHRVVERRRDLLAEETQEAKREFQAEQCHPTSSADLLKVVAPTATWSGSGT